jgi:protein-S-isoprenylcysteine O-methyltransferase Ste14
MGDSGHSVGSLLRLRQIGGPALDAPSRVGDRQKMLNGLSDIISSMFSGWLVTWPTGLLSLIWLAWVTSWIAASFWSGRTKSHVPTLDSWVYRLPILLGALCLTPPIERLLGAEQLYRLGDAWIFLLGAVVVLGLSFTWWARIHLGRFWSNAITHKEDHRIIDTGPYGIVRHPIYTGQMIGLFATGIAIGNWAAMLGAFLISFGEWQKGRMEERFLSVELGAEDYGAYCRRVPMIVPFLRF